MPARAINGPQLQTTILGESFAKRRSDFAVQLGAVEILHRHALASGGEQEIHAVHAAHRRSLTGGEPSALKESESEPELPLALERLPRRSALEEDGLGDLDGQTIHAAEREAAPHLWQGTDESTQ